MDTQVTLTVEPTEAPRIENFRHHGVRSEFRYRGHRVVVESPPDDPNTSTVLLEGRQIGVVKRERRVAQKGSKRIYFVYFAHTDRRRQYATRSAAAVAYVDAELDKAAPQPDSTPAVPNVDALDDVRLALREFEGWTPTADAALQILVAELRRVTHTR